jgi:DNA mismatch repair protein MSH5
LTQYEQVVAEDVGLSFKKGNILRLAGLIDIENTVSLGCAGAIITHLQRRTTNEYASTSISTGYEIRSIETFTFKETM